jgi:hypothetical protein
MNAAVAARELPRYNRKRMSRAREPLLSTGPGSGRTLTQQTPNQERFLICFAACGQIKVAARWAKLHHNCHYRWLDADPTYADRFADAERKATRRLRDEAYRRAHDGVKRAIRYRGHIVAYDLEYSDTLMLAMLKALDPAFRDRTGPLVNIDMRAELERKLEEIAFGGDQAKIEAWRRGEAPAIEPAIYKDAAEEPEK